MAAQLLAERRHDLEAVQHDALVQLVKCHLGEVAPQRDGGGLGDPAVTLYEDRQRKFYIEALFHIDVSTAIHDHAFSGAFIVTDGTCAHQKFEFEVDGSGSHLLGELSPTKADRIGPGTVLQIESGPRFVHRNLHLSKPTVTVVVRTEWDGIYQHTYTADGIRLPIKTSAENRVQLTMLRSLAQIDRGKALQFAVDAIAHTRSSEQAIRLIYAAWHHLSLDEVERMNLVMQSESALDGSVGALVRSAAQFGAPALADDLLAHAFLDEETAR
ncbi:hypothetical protein [Flexivirga oryzae]|uniref:Cysteine dioxygenase n=1 Tax=Flexivirga oryzae TaxID=1794944 RepID=A0A839N8H9_9MICO|nr:hypothetical protein [Flexivirga oryzae]MBB2890962.1 hypothetical protein [Flexivirga oryzae]